MNYSYQRAKILDCVLNSYDHPTAQMVYQKIKEDIPNISLGTVYRNLNLLTELGKIKKISVPNEKEHFDKTLEDHHHFYCIRCGQVNDINTINQNKIDLNQLFLDTEHKLISCELLCTVICKNCLKLEGKKK